MAYRSEVVCACNGSLALEAQEVQAQAAPALRVVEGAKPGSPTAAPASHADSDRLSGRSLRLSAAVATVAVAVVLGSWGALDAAHAGRVADALSNCATQSVEVSRGDSLWSIAEAHPVEGVSTPEVVSWIVEANNLPNSSVASGQALVVPARG